ncbi:MAG: hypothetical protein AAGA30_07880 [Planctomycetota bacterium]
MRPIIRINRQRSGLVLVMTVMLLAVTALIVVGISRHSLFLATTVKQNRDDLTEKWAVASCQRFWLKHGGKTLKKMENANLVFNIELSGHSIVNQIRDESARLDVNSIFDRMSRQDWKTLVRKLAHTTQLQVQPRPLQIGSQENSRNPFESWGQVFTARIPDHYLEIRVASETLSCWGGKLNIHTAKPETVKETTKILAGSILANRIQKALAEQSNISIGDLFITIEANDRQMQMLRRVLDDRSSATSIWTDVISEEKQTSYFAVQQRPMETISRYQTFRWQ